MVCLVQSRSPLWIVSETGKSAFSCIPLVANGIFSLFCYFEIWLHIFYYSIRFWLRFTRRSTRSRGWQISDPRQTTIFGPLSWFYWHASLASDKIWTSPYVKLGAFRWYQNFMCGQMSNENPAFCRVESNRIPWWFLKLALFGNGNANIRRQKGLCLSNISTLIHYVNHLGFTDRHTNLSRPRKSWPTASNCLHCQYGSRGTAHNHYLFCCKAVVLICQWAGHDLTTIRID